LIYDNGIVRVAMLVALLVPIPARALPLRFVPQTLNLYFSAGENPMNRRGHSVFRSLHLEIAGRSDLLPKRLRNAEVGAVLTYSDLRQARSWFGYTYGDPDDSVRAETLSAFIRKDFGTSPVVRPYADIGTGVMWSNRRVPAATSRLNVNSQLSLGVIAFPNSRAPIRIGYRFSHISNGGTTGRNPGLNVSSVFLGVQLKKPGAPPVAALQQKPDQ
jgi:hypothetical protein